MEPCCGFGSSCLGMQAYVTAPWPAGHSPACAGSRLVNYRPITGPATLSLAGLDGRKACWPMLRVRALAGQQLARCGRLECASTKASPSRALISSCNIVDSNCIHSSGRASSPVDEVKEINLSADSPGLDARVTKGSLAKEGTLLRVGIMYIWPSCAGHAPLGRATGVARAPTAGLAEGEAEWSAASRRGGSLCRILARAQAVSS